MNDGLAELVPGVWATGADLFVCPGCGLLDCGGNPEDPQEVTDWCVGAFAALADVGIYLGGEDAARETADAYIKEPWHV